MRNQNLRLLIKQINLVRKHGTMPADRHAPRKKTHTLKLNEFLSKTHTPSPSAIRSELNGKENGAF